jgi:hypothetical protein
MCFKEIQMKSLLFAAGVLAAAMTGGAQASILSITGSGGFLEGSADDNFPGTIYEGCAGGGVCTSFSWGIPSTTDGPFNGQSGASINIANDYGDDSDNDGRRSPFDAPSENAISWNPNTLGDAFVLGSLTHFNRPLDSEPFEGTVDVRYDFAITMYEDDGETLIGAELFSRIFEVVFVETDDALFPCPGRPPGETGECGDTFQFLGDEVINFQIAGQKYGVEVIGFCSGASLDTCSDGVFYSPEEGSSVGFVLEIKREVQAPAPGVLALISAGLVGLGFARRRQAKA